MVARAAWILVQGVALAPAPAAADAAPAGPGQETRHEIHLSPDLGAETGARLVAAAVAAVGAAEQGLFARPGEPSRASRSPRAFALRGARTIVWDLPVAWWFGVALHEAFGHGGRAREFNASPGVRLGSPWQGRVSRASFDARGRSTEELLYIYAGGAEANGLAATLLERRAVRGMRLRPFELLHLAANRLVVADYVLRTTPDPSRDPEGFVAEHSGGGDVARYLGYLHALNGGTAPGIAPGSVDASIVRQYRRLRRQAVLSLLDPGLWWALGSAFTKAESGAGPIPLPRLRLHRVLPVLSAEWTPSGGQTSLEIIMAPVGSGGVPEAVGDIAPAPDRTRRSGLAPSCFSLVARRGRGPAGAFGALGAAAEDLLPAGPFVIGGTAEIWRDPRHGFGGGARLRARLDRGALRGLYLDLGLKSQGYWPGQPATPGPYGAVGVVWGR
jgi:hypothetical protein